MSGYLLIFLCGLAGGVLLVRYGLVSASLGLEPATPAAGHAKATEPAVAAIDAAVVDASADAAPQTMEQQLTRLRARLEEIGDQAGHPRDIAEASEFKEAVARMADAAQPVSLAQDRVFKGPWVLGAAALVALTQREDGSAALADICAGLDQLGGWQIHYAFPYFLRHGQPDMALGAPFVCARDWWATTPVIVDAAREYFSACEARGDAVALGVGYEHVAVDQLAQSRALLMAVRHPSAVKLADIIGELERRRIDRPSLEVVGRFWAQGQGQELIVPDGWNDTLEQAKGLLQRVPPRSLIVSGDPLVGKTSFLQLLAENAGSLGWTVFETATSELQAGQSYIGQLEGRIKKLVDEINLDKKVIWHIPDLFNAVRAGMHQGQTSGLMDQIIPALASGRVVIWGEARPSELAKLLNARPTLARHFEVIRLIAPPKDEALRIAERFASKLGERSAVRVQPDAARVAVDVATAYLSATSLPGSALGLMRLAAERVEVEKRASVGPADILATLARATGLPLSILDGGDTLRLGDVRAFFSARIVGQRDAVDAVVERIAMLKSGLNDPGKPIGVLLFAGPTGTGKTELAKATAEYLFGSADRMIRLDMSEYQSPDSISKIIGSGALMDEAETLTSRVRKTPFSVVLLDEFEKASPRVWDLFLQVFDDGRLTDGAGQTVDFRHTLIILTTNLGATAHQTRGLGFQRAAQGFQNTQVLEAVGQVFRPEFQNRLDKVIVFHPLSRDLMRGILKKELSRVFERRGLKDRAWAVEWEASALEFLLEKGFSPEMGARPLKRAIDQYLIAPLAATIVEQRFPKGDQFVFVKSDGAAIQAEFVDPDGNAGEAAGLINGSGRLGDARSLPEIILAPQGSVAEVGVLDAALDDIFARVQANVWSDQKAALADAMSDAGFWQRAERFQTLTQLARMDRIETALDTALSLRDRLKSRTKSGAVGSTELIGRLALQTFLVREGIADVDEGAAIEVLVAIEPALDGHGNDVGEAAAWTAQLRDMYRGWAEKRHMHITDAPGRRPAGVHYLLVTGFGAARALSDETGLHVREDAGNGAVGRSAARVRVGAIAPGEDKTSARADAIASALTLAGTAQSVARRYRREPSPLVRNRDGTWRTGKLDQVLSGDFDLMQAAGL